MNEHDIRFMEHALELARKGVGLASPNPTVGCVIVRDGEIAGEGFHEYDKRDHAEIVALRQAGERARGATLYVTLEPCNHTGRTGPCTEAILAAGVTRVVAAVEDASPKVSGAGIERLRKSGLQTEFAPGEERLAATELNEGFFHWAKSGQPFVTLKAAMTLDGQLALPAQRKNKNREWITSEKSREEVHRMRHAADALLTGIGTVLADDPRLTDRSGLPRRRKLLRVVLDSRLRLPEKTKLVREADGDVLVVTSAPAKSPKARRLRSAGVELLNIPSQGRKSFLIAALKELGRREMLNVLLEAGPTLNGTALSGGRVQRLVLFYAPKLAGNFHLPLANQPEYTLPPIRFLSFRQFGPDFAIIATIPRPGKS